MDRIKGNAEAAARPRGLAGDFHTLKAGSTASVEELREFVRQLRGKDPQQMLGIVAQSGLLMGVVHATVLTVVVIGIFTIGPYLFYKAEPAAVVTQAAPEAASPAKQTADSPKSQPATSTPVAEPSATVSNDKSKPAAADGIDKGKALEKLNMSEAKKADPNANPLENKADDLLKDLK